MQTLLKETYYAKILKRFMYFGLQRIFHSYRRLRSHANLPCLVNPALRFCYSLTQVVKLKRKILYDMMCISAERASILLRTGTGFMGNAQEMKCIALF